MPCLQSSSLLVYLRLQLFTINTNCAVRQLNCPHQNSQHCNVQIEKKKHPSWLKHDERTFTAWQSHFAVICWRGCIQSGCVTDFCLSLFRLIETAGESPKSRRSNPGQRRVWFVLCLAFNAAGAVCWCVLGCLFNASKKKKKERDYG